MAQRFAVPLVNKRNADFEITQEHLNEGDEFRYLQMFFEVAPVGEELVWTKELYERALQTFIIQATRVDLDFLVNLFVYIAIATTDPGCLNAEELPDAEMRKFFRESMYNKVSSAENPEAFQKIKNIISNAFARQENIDDEEWQQLENKFKFSDSQLMELMDLQYDCFQTRVLLALKTILKKRLQKMDPNSDRYIELYSDMKDAWNENTMFPYANRQIKNRMKNIGKAVAMRKLRQDLPEDVASFIESQCQKSDDDDDDDAMS